MTPKNRQRNGRLMGRELMPSNTRSDAPNTSAENLKPKRKTTRKKAINTTKKTTRAPKNTTAAREILFKDLPIAGLTPMPPYIWIDHPQDDDMLSAPHYAIRLGVAGALLVEISIDKSPWVPCRSTSGYWWYDWSGITLGKHPLSARMHLSDGRIFRTPVRTCTYRL